MTFVSDHVETLTFDSFGTLVDVGASAEPLEEHTDKPEAVAAAWRRRALTYSLLSEPLDHYETYSQLHRYGLEYAADQQGLQLTAEQLDDINEVYRELPAFPDVEDALQWFEAAGYDLYIISNGEPAMLEGLLETTGIGDYLDGAISADEIKTFKPNPEVYRLAVERSGTPADRIAHVAGLIFDVRGAQRIGMQGVWLDRRGFGTDPFGDPPDLRVETLTELKSDLG